MTESQATETAWDYIRGLGMNQAVLVNTTFIDGDDFDKHCRSSPPEELKVSWLFSFEEPQDDSDTTVHLGGDTRIVVLEATGEAMAEDEYLLRAYPNE